MAASKRAVEAKAISMIMLNLRAIFAIPVVEIAALLEGNTENFEVISMDDGVKNHRLFRCSRGKPALLRAPNHPRALGSDHDCWGPCEAFLPESSERVPEELQDAIWFRLSPHGGPRLPAVWGHQGETQLPTDARKPWGRLMAGRPATFPLRHRFVWS